MEHLNRVVKNGIHGLGANKAEKAMIRIGKCVDSVAYVLYNIMTMNLAPSGQHTIASQQKDLDLLMQELTTRVNPFIQLHGRKHSHVNVPNNTLLKRSFQHGLEESGVVFLLGLYEDFFKCFY